LIQVEGLTKRYRSVVAVSDVTFEVRKGSVSGLLGPNGAGKTTTLRMLAGVLGSTHGTVRMCGFDIVNQPLDARRCLGYLPESSPLYPELTPRQYLSHRAALKGLPRSRCKTGPIETAVQTGCEEVLDVPIHQLSRGYRQRVGLADVLLANPSILLLDEPTAGLDPNQVRALRDALLRLRDDHAIVIGTHVLSEVEAFCTHVLLMHHGRLVENDSIKAIQSRNSSVEIELQLSDPQNCATAILRDFGWKIREEHSLRSTYIDAEASGALCFRAYRSAPPSDSHGAIEVLISALVQGGIGVRGVTRLTHPLPSAIADLMDRERAEICPDSSPH
jgi:ABC-2 type transport system ATP-binding protein